MPTSPPPMAGVEVETGETSAVESTAVTDGLHTPPLQTPQISQTTAKSSRPGPPPTIGRNNRSFVSPIISLFGSTIDPETPISLSQESGKSVDSAKGMLQ